MTDNNDRFTNWRSTTPPDPQKLAEQHARYLARKEEQEILESENRIRELRIKAQRDADNEAYRLKREAELPRLEFRRKIGQIFLATVIVFLFFLFSWWCYNLYSRHFGLSVICGIVALVIGLTILTGIYHILFSDIFWPDLSFSETSTKESTKVADNEKDYDDLSTFSTRRKDGSSAQVVVHIQFKAEGSATQTLYRVKIALQRSINEHFLANDNPTYATLDTSFIWKVPDAFKADGITRYSIKTVDIK